MATIAIRDTFFMNPELALRVAKEQNTLTVCENPFEWTTGQTDVRTQKRQEFYGDLQICYYFGEKLNLTSVPKNLVHVHMSKVYDFFKTTKLRYPEVINFEGLPLSDQEKENIVGLFQKALHNANNYKMQKAHEFAKIIKESKPNFNEPLRIFLLANRHTTVLQFVSQNIATAFKKMNYNVVVFIEKNKMQEHHTYHHLKKFANFNPHIVISINHLNNDFINRHIFNIVWFQDPMPILTDNQSIQLRKRDILYSVSNEIMSCKFTTKQYKIQDLCLNENIYFRNKKIKKENKIVFIGSSYISTAFEHPDNNIKKLYYIFRQKLESSEIITQQMIQKLASTFMLSYNDVLFHSLAVAVRECCVEWICRQKVIKVEIYGRHWEQNSIVKPFYKGELPYGSAVAEVYNSAKYGLSAHPAAMYQQRLLEMTACGTIPIAYDATNIVGDYKYSDNSLLFSNYNHIVNALTQEPKKSVYKIAKDMPYRKFVKRILKSVKKDLKNDR